MQPMPSLLMQSFRLLYSLPRPSAANPRSPLPVKPILRPARGYRVTHPSVCLRCQLRAQTRFYSTNGGNDPLRDKQTGNEGNEVNAKSKGASNPDRDQPFNQESQPTTHPVGSENAAKQNQGPKNAAGDEQHGLPSEAESRRSNFARRFGDVMDGLQSNVFIAGRHLNDLTGYSSIEKLKREIIAQEDRVRETRATVRQAKETYSSAINRRSASQREVNELLQRKHAWTPTDLERFTSLYRSDHANERAETEAQEALAAAERDAEEAAAMLSKNILARYHEEQIWSDKIRRMSTWGTWGLMGVNVLLFLIFQIGVEPWRRQRLVKGFEEKVIEALEKEKVNEKDHDRDIALKSDETDTASGAAQTDPQTAVAEVDPLTPEMTAELSAGEGEPPSSDPFRLSFDNMSVESWSQTVRDLFSDRRVSLSQRGLTTVALESAAAGAAVMGLLIALLRPR